MSPTVSLPGVRGLVSMLLSLVLLSGTSASQQTNNLTEANDLPWGWPSGSPAAVLVSFDLPEKHWMPGHRGVDLALVPGDPIYSPASGTVIFTGMVAGRPVISVMHAGGLRSTYEPASAALEVGHVVEKGTLIGHLEEPPDTYSHLGLHWGARFGPNEYINPLRMIAGPSVLKPWD